MVPQEKREALKGLFEYMPFLVNTKYEDIVTWTEESPEEGGYVPVAYPHYSEEFLDFIGYIISEDLLDRDYNYTLMQACGGEVEFSELVEALDVVKYDVVIACLSYLIFQEGYNHGALAAAFQKRWLYMILYRLKQLCEE